MSRKDWKMHRYQIKTANGRSIMAVASDLLDLAKLLESVDLNARDKRRDYVTNISMFDTEWDDCSTEAYFNEDSLGKLECKTHPENWYSGNHG